MRIRMIYYRPAAILSCLRVPALSHRTDNVGYRLADGAGSRYHRPCTRVPLVRTHNAG